MHGGGWQQHIGAGGGLGRQGVERGADLQGLTGAGQVGEVGQANVGGQGLGAGGAAAGAVGLGLHHAINQATTREDGQVGAVKHSRVRAFGVEAAAAHSQTGSPCQGRGGIEAAAIAGHAAGQGRGRGSTGEAQARTGLQQKIRFEA